MVAGDVMGKEVVCVREDDSAADLTDLLQHAHVHGAPVVDKDGELVGIVSQEDILIGGMAEPSEAGETAKSFPLVRDIMTSPAISGAEDTPLQDLCRMMWRLRIHHVPIVADSKVLGMVSSLDICRAIGDGTIRV